MYIFYFTKKFQILVFWEVHNDTWCEPPPQNLVGADEFWTVIVPGGLVFSDFFYGGGPGICTYVFLYKNLAFLVPWIRISLNLLKILQFLKISLIFSLIYLKAVAQKCYSQQSWAWHVMTLPMTVTLDGPLCKNYYYF